MSYIVLTRDRLEALVETLERLRALHGSGGGGGSGGRRLAHEIIVVDNGGWTRGACSSVRAGSMAVGGEVRWLGLARNLGGAARNAGVELARHEWVVMLDDDSSPVDLGFVQRLARLEEDVAALSADVWMPGLMRRETGGLPEVFVNCGVAIRRRAFLEVGGYDAAFGSHAEEYDLAARLLLAGYRVVHDPWFRVEHRRGNERSGPRAGAGGAGGAICAASIRALVCRNAWLMQRYAPEGCRRERLREVRARYRRVAGRADAMGEYALGLRDWRQTIACQARRAMPRDVFDRFTGLAAARECLGREWRERAFAIAALVEEGRNAWCVRAALEELGVRVVASEREAEVAVIGTMAPGPMLDALERRVARGGVERVIAPWRVVMDRLRPIPADVLTGGGGGRRVDEGALVGRV